MKIRELMTERVETITPQTTLMEAAEKMRALDVGSIPVCEGPRAVGIVTDRDLVIRAVAKGCDVRTTKVSEVMTSPVEFCGADDDVEDAADHMKEKQIRRVLVQDTNGALLGILSLGDLAVDGGRKLAGKALKEISEPAAPSQH